MPFYSKAAKDMVLDLINQANPGLAIKATASTVKLGVPTALSGVSYPAPNTSILVQGTSTGEYIGKQTLKYRRLDLSAIFRGVTVQIAKYKDVSALAFDSVVYTVYQLLADINSKFGLTLTQDDINTVNILRGTTQENGQYTSTVTVTTKATSLGFTGSFALKWLNTAQSLDTVVTVTDINGRTFPGGNTFDANHLPVLSSLGYGYDWTDLAIKWLGAAPSITGGLVSNGSLQAQFAQEAAVILNNLFGTTLPTNWWAAFNYAVVPLPSTVYPAANGVDFNRALVLIPPVSNPAYAGPIFFHFNI